jgi:hypothetical protein
MMMMMMMMTTEMDIETSVYNVHLTRLEDFIKFTRRESTKTYIISSQCLFTKASHREQS